MLRFYLHFVSSLKHRIQMCSLYYLKILLVCIYQKLVCVMWFYYIKINIFLL